MSPRFRPHPLIWLCIAASAVASGWIAVQRHRVEASAKAVHLAATIEDVRLVAAAAGEQPATALARLKAAGLTAVVVSEETFEHLILSGRLAPAGAGADRFRCGDRELFDRISAAIHNRFPAQGLGGSIVGPNGDRILLPAPAMDLKLVGVGFDPATADLVTAAGLATIARSANPTAATASSVRWVVEEASRVGAAGLIFVGDQVLGWEKAIPDAARALESAGIWYGNVEFGNQAGASTLAEETLRTHLRVHSMLAAEMTQSAVSSIRDRYARAATERNIRVLFLRPPRPADQDPLDAFVSFVANLRADLVRQGSNAGIPKPIRSPDPPIWTRLAAAFGGLVLAGWLWTRVTRGWLALAGIVGLGVIAGLALVTMGDGGSTLPTKAAAAIAAISFPIWAVVAAFSGGSAPTGVTRCLAAYAWISFVSVVGGLHVAAILTDLSFMVHADQFLGVKLAHFIPPAVVGGYLLFESSGFRGAMSGGVRWQDMAILAVVLAAIALTIVRTGNEAPSAVGGWELRMRDILDRILPERPRTKEALIGNPALVVALGLGSVGARAYLPLACLLAALGQASIVNTFCHLHTPIEVSVLRVLMGLLTGGIFGLVLWLVVRRFAGVPTPSR